ncbi:hypothetical protein L1987_29723 [Smallanthus sonchifolius]|uniref:Uncharacterized protein n=1 Tax=Smallanthus sonchifolius TaxID=185202 RepID=A0ACB9I0R6_9ASTR|nr:hypothetical protein L1987_29723 [Smallanthus sonchifolius]
MLNEAVNLSIEEGDVAKKDETTSAMAAIPVTVINVTNIQTVNSGGSKSIVNNILVDQEAGSKKDNEKGKVEINKDEPSSFSLGLTQMFPSQTNCEERSEEFQQKFHQVINFHLLQYHHVDVDGQIATMGNEGVETSITNFEEQLVGIGNEEMTNIERSILYELHGDLSRKKAMETNLKERRKGKCEELEKDVISNPRAFPWMLNDENTNKEKRMECFRKNMKVAVKGDDKMVDLKAFDMVLFLVLEFNHYYLLVFELKNTSISVIDNSCDKYPFVRMLNNKEYFKKDSCYKIKLTELKRMRKKMAAHIQLSSANVLRGKVVDVAEKKGKVVALLRES